MFEKPQCRGKLKAVFIVTVIFFAIGMIQIYRPALYRHLDKLKLIPTQERFTELYFNDYPILQKEEIVKGKAISFSFAIHNVEGMDRAYAYRVYAKFENGVIRELEHGTHFIKDNQAQNFPVSFALPFATQKVTVVVELPGEQQVIHFSIPTNT
ncbi:MAG: hypothetical protein AAB408_00910 [Patescibacteria group bacterium]